MDLAPYIEHTCLGAQATPSDIDRLVDEAIRHGFHGVCVAPRYVARSASRIGSRGSVVTVVGFPLGGSTAAIKAEEARAAAEDGATEIDMVLPVGEALVGSWEIVGEDVARVREAVPSLTLKVILETGYLDRDRMRLAALTSVEAGADFVKTSTGYGPRGASVDDVRWLAEVVRGRARIKASGGIRTREEAERLVEAGATRIGTSRGTQIVDES